MQRYALGLMSCLLLALTACQVSNSPTLVPAHSTSPKTAEPVLPTASVTQPPAAATVIAPPTLTPVPLRRPNQDFWDALDKYELVSASTVGPDNLIYSAYVLADPSRPGSCQLAFFRWDGYDYTQIELIEVPTGCETTNWDWLQIEPHERQTLRLKGYWSDINQNGQPELTIFHADDCSVCDESSGRTAIYEIQSATTIVDITAGLPGEIALGRILHSANPLTIYLHELYPYGAHVYAGIAAIYQWDGKQFVDVSLEYVVEFQHQVDEIIAQLQQGYGRSLTHTDINKLQTLLAIYNRLRLPQQEGLEKYLEVTQPSHWPGTENLTLCWLQLSRAQAQLDYEQQQPFQLYPINSVNLVPDLTVLTRDIDTSRFDVSACQ